jgi:hypothetical protein
VRCGWGGEGIRERDLWNIDGWMDRKRVPVTTSERRTARVKGRERKGKEGSGGDNASPKEWRKGRTQTQTQSRAEDEWTTGTAREDLENDMRRVD